MKYRFIFDKCFALLVSILLLNLLSNQLTAQSDTTILSYQFYIKNLLAEHPIARQTDLLNDLAEAEMRGAKGFFDPQLSSNWNDKFFKDKHYYRLFNSSLEIPTWAGITLKTTYENNRGEFLNAENTTSSNGLWSVGLEANILQGLVIDERRAALKQATLFQSMTFNERLSIRNYLIQAATAAYLDWQMNHAVQAVIQQSITLAEEYFEGTRIAYLNGDKPAIDTLEAFMIIQDRRALLQSNSIKLNKSRQNLENFLWSNQIPQTLNPNTVPEPLDNPLLSSFQQRGIGEIINSHPDILSKELKRESKIIERRLKNDKLKPKLKLKYNPLLSTTEESIAPNYSLADYKWGFSFSTPLLWRKERAALDKTDLQIREIDLDLSEKRNTLQNKIEASLQNQVLLQDQLELIRQNSENYLALQVAEQEKFSYGESSVFLLNKRQEKYLDAQIKVIEVRTKYLLEILNYLYLSNDLSSLFE